jgi:hypothetical protein
MAKIAALVHAVMGFAALTDQKLLMFANAVLKTLTGSIGILSEVYRPL